MPWQQFVASLVESLAWPAVVLLVVLLLRKPLMKALRERDIKSFSAGPSGVSIELWERRLEETRSSLDLPPSPGRKPHQSGPSDPSNRFLEELLDMAIDFPEAAIIEGFRRFDGLLIATYHQWRSMTDEGPIRQLPRQQTLLKATEEAGLLTPSESRAVVSLRNLRNAAAHGQGVPVDADSAWDYLDSLNQIAEKMRLRARTTNIDLPPL